MSRMTVVACVLLAVCSGCAGMGVHVHGRTGDANPLTVGRTRDSAEVGRTTPGVVGSSTGKTHSSSLETRRVCRGGPWPSGWIAIGYAASESECFRAAGTRASYNVAIIARFETQPVGQTIEVCADQTIPFGWVTESSDDVRGDACPGAGKDGTSATRLIRRVR